MVVVEQYHYMEYGLPQHSTAVRLPHDGGEFESECLDAYCVSLLFRGCFYVIYSSTARHPSRLHSAMVRKL